MFTPQTKELQVSLRPSNDTDKESIKEMFEIKINRQKWIDQVENGIFYINNAIKNEGGIDILLNYGCRFLRVYNCKFLLILLLVKISFFESGRRK